jgi:hypothetical protein
MTGRRDAPGESAGGVIVDQHPGTGPSVRVEHHTTPLPVPEGDRIALAAAIDAVPLHGTPFLLTLRQVMLPIHIW